MSKDYYFECFSINVAEGKILRTDLKQSLFEANSRSSDLPGTLGYVAHFITYKKMKTGNTALFDFLKTDRSHQDLTQIMPQVESALHPRFLPFISLYFERKVNS